MAEEAISHARSSFSRILMGGGAGRSPGRRVMVDESFSHACCTPINPRPVTYQPANSRGLY